VKSTATVRSVLYLYLTEVKMKETRINLQAVRRKCELRDQIQSAAFSVHRPEELYLYISHKILMSISTY